MALSLLASPARAADAKFSQEKLILTLQSAAPPQDKALACKHLAIYGTDKAVPALAPLLADEQLASWARIALEAIPGQAADAALRQAMDKLHGQLLIGTINSIGVRRDARAVNGLAARLTDSDHDAACAAAVALGRVGNKQAAQVLQQALAEAPGAVRPAVAEGCIRCAEQLLADGKSGRAVQLYDAVRCAEVPKQKILEATRGAILARQAAGLPMLLQQLRSNDKAFFDVGLRTARELPGKAVTKALAAELEQCPPDRQPALLLALADRQGPLVLAKLIQSAKSGPKKLRMTAIILLEHSGNSAGLPVLLEVAAGSDPEVSQAALGALTRLPGNEVNANLQARLSVASGKTKQILIELAGLRRIEAAIPSITQYAEDPDAAIRCAALRTLGTLGDAGKAASLVRMLNQSKDPADRANLESALLAISGRTGGACVRHLLPLAQCGDPALRVVALHALAAAGGPEALSAVNAATADRDGNVSDEAVRALSSWPNTWPEDSAAAAPLLALARSSQKQSYQVLALRGYLQCLQADKKFKNAQKAADIRELLALLVRPEEKRLAIAVLRAAPSGPALKLLTGFVSEPAIAEDAWAAILDVAEKGAPDLLKEDRQRALQAAAEKSSSQASRTRAAELLKKIQ